MASWQPFFFPCPGEQNSPEDYINGLDNVNEAANIQIHIETVCRLTPAYWIGYKPIKPIDTDLWQLTVGKHRIYITLNSKDHMVVIVYACKKVSQKAKPQDLKRAMANRDKYHELT